MIKRNALPRKARITTTKDFNEIISNGKVLRAEAFRIHYLDNHADKSRIGIIISRHIKDKAIKHKYKRTIKEYFRLNRNKYLMKVDIVIIVLKKSEKIVAQNINKMLQKEKILE